MHKLIAPFLLFLLGCQQPAPPTPVCPPTSEAAAVKPCPPVVADAGPPEPPAPTPVVDAGPAPTDACALGEQELLKLACKDSRGRLIGGPNMHGEPWAQVCRDNKKNNVDMKPACIAAAKTCKEVEACR